MFPQNILIIFQVFSKLCEFYENILSQTEHILSAILCLSGVSTSVALRYLVLGDKMSVQY